jgi:hypothetical protein
MMVYPKIKKVTAKENYILEVVFENEIKKLYDCKNLFNNSVFERIKNSNYFKKVENNICPYAVVWDDEIDLAESEIWVNGKISS